MLTYVSVYNSLSYDSAFMKNMNKLIWQPFTAFPLVTSVETILALRIEDTWTYLKPLEKCWVRINLLLFMMSSLYDKPKISLYFVFCKMGLKPPVTFLILYCIEVLYDIFFLKVFKILVKVNYVVIKNNIAT